MIYIYRSDINQFRGKVSLKKLLEQVPKKMHDRAFRYQFEQDAYCFVLGRIILKQGLEALETGLTLEDVVIDSEGKPELPGIFFSISHSANWVVCAFSQEGPIGIDIEIIADKKTENFQPWFTQKEWADILSAPNTSEKILWYWTRKESIIKAMGVNLSHLNQIEIDSSKDHFQEGQHTWHLKDLSIHPDFLAALCTKAKDLETKIIDM